MEVSTNGGTQKMMVYKGKSIYIWMIWGYPYFRKPPYMCIPKYVIYIYTLPPNSPTTMEGVQQAEQQ